MKQINELMQGDKYGYEKKRTVYAVSLLMSLTSLGVGNDYLTENNRYIYES